MFVNGKGIKIDIFILFDVLIGVADHVFKEERLGNFCRRTTKEVFLPIVTFIITRFSQSIAVGRGGGLNFVISSS